ncbi:MAG: DUF4157 domain-containing protein, partial [Acidobacteria bacterium]|nr:DUF4157 domain-containing protein [Acidobacteriota bacterium]
MDSPTNPNEAAADHAAAQASESDSPGSELQASRISFVAPSDDGAELPSNIAAAIVRPSGGTALPVSLRAEQESRLGSALSHVRIHQGAHAAALADVLGARAFTYGCDIWLGAGETIADRGLMSHELAHVTQQMPRPLREAPTTSGDENPSTRLQATRRYYYALPTLGKGSKGPGDRTHAQVQEILGKETKNQPIFSEVPVPEGAATGATGRADFLKTDTGAYLGVKFSGNNPAFLALGSKTLLNGAEASDATHRKTAAPAGNTGIEGGKACGLSGLPASHGICRVDQGPASVSIADLKPNYEAEVLLGASQVDRYINQVNNLSTKVNNFATANPTLIHPAGRTWTVSAKRMADIHIPPKFESPTSSSPQVLVNLYVNGTPTDITDQAVLRIAKHSDGFITYEFVPPRLLGTGTATGGAATAKSPIAEAKTKLDPVKTELKDQPKRVANLSRPPASRARLARKRDKLEAKDNFNFATWNKSTFEPWQSAAKTATGGQGKKALTDPSAEAKQRLKDEAARQIDARTNLATKSAPKGTAERTRELELVQHWVDHGEKYGRLRQFFGSAFVKVVEVYDSVKAKIEAKVAATKARMARVGGGGIKGAVLSVLRGVAATLLGIFIRDVGHRLVTAVEKGATVLLGTLFGDEVEAVEEQLKKIEQAEADFRKMIAETLEEKFGEQIKVLEEKIAEIETIAATVSDITTIVNVVKWAYRVAQCAAPPVLGCVIAVVATEVAEAAIAAIVASCWFQREIAYPAVSALGPIRKLPGVAAKAIANRVRDLLPDSVKPLIGEVDLSDLESKANDVECDSGGKYDLDPSQRKLAEMLQQYDPDHVEALMKALKHLGVDTEDPDPDLKITDNDIARIKKLLDTHSKAALEDIVAKSPARPPRQVGTSDLFDLVDAAVKNPTGQGTTGGPSAAELKQEGAEVARRLKPLTSMPANQDRFAPGDAQPGTTTFVFYASNVDQLKGGYQKVTVVARKGDESINVTLHAGTRFYNLKGELVETKRTTTTDTFKLINP